MSEHSRRAGAGPTIWSGTPLAAPAPSSSRGLAAAPAPHRAGGSPRPAPHRAGGWSVQPAAADSSERLPAVGAASSGAWSSGASSSRRLVEPAAAAASGALAAPRGDTRWLDGLRPPSVARHRPERRCAREVPAFSAHDAPSAGTSSAAGAGGLLHHHEARHCPPSTSLRTDGHLCGALSARDVPRPARPMLAEAHGRGRAPPYRRA